MQATFSTFKLHSDLIFPYLNPNSRMFLLKAGDLTHYSNHQTHVDSSCANLYLSLNEGRYVTVFLFLYFQDINDHKPVFTSSYYNATVSEDHDIQSPIMR